MPLGLLRSSPPQSARPAAQASLGEAALHQPGSAWIKNAAAGIRLDPVDGSPTGIRLDPVIMGWLVDGYGMVMEWFMVNNGNWFLLGTL